MTNDRKPKMLLGITGGIAAYKSAFLLRLLKKTDIDIQVVMTEAATKFISKLTMQALSGKPVCDNMWAEEHGHGMSHIETSRGCRLILVAPASANFIAKLATGTANDLLSTICLARNCELMIAPAMNKEMWDNKSTQRNIEMLKRDGVHIVGPVGGDQACGEVGLGRMAEPETIYQTTLNFFQPRLFKSKKIIITAGGTFEKIDAVRGITNQSSGRMGFAIAQAAIEYGAEVILIVGTYTASPPLECKLVKVQSAADMLEAVLDHIETTDIFISAAAVSDYRVKDAVNHKLKKDSQFIHQLQLEPTEDILKKISTMENPPFCVGFSAETENLEKNAQHKRKLKGIPLIVGNLIPQAMGSDFNELLLIDKNGVHKLPRDTKIRHARNLLNHISRIYE